MPNLPQNRLSHDAQRALDDVLACFGLEAALKGLSEGQSNIHKRVLRFYAEHGRAPTIAELRRGNNVTETHMTGIVSELAMRDLLLLEEGEIIGAYPFTNRDSGVTVRCGAEPVHAMCAIDALGMGAMLARDIEVRGQCAHCKTPVEVRTAHEGASIQRADPMHAMVWVGLHKKGPAATSLCSVILFVCNQQHLDAWLDSQEPMRGHALGLPDALAVGRSLFGDILGPQPSEMDHGPQS